MFTFGAVASRLRRASAGADVGPAATLKNIRRFSFNLSKIKGQKGCNTGKYLQCVSFHLRKIKIRKKIRPFSPCFGFFYAKHLKTC